MKEFRQKTYNLLRKSEKYFKTDMVYLAKGGSWLTVGQIVTSVSALLLAIAFANLLSKETYGIYRYILSLAAIIGALSLTGMGTAITQAVSRGFDGALKEGFKVNFKWSIFMVLASMSAALYYFLHENYSLAISMLIIGAFSPFLSSADIYTNFLVGKKDFKTPAIYSSIRNTLTAFFLFIAMAFAQNPIFLVFVYFSSNTAFALAFYYITIQKHSPSEKTVPETITFGKHQSLMNMLGIVAEHIDKILIFHFLGAAELAIYAFALAVPEQIKGSLKSIGTLALPKFSQRATAEIKVGMSSKMLRMGSIILLLTAFYILFAPTIYTVLFPQYAESIFYSQLFAISLVAVISVIPLSALQSKLAKRQLYIFNIYGAIIQITILFIFIYFYGLLGAIIARILTRFINMGMSIYLAKNINP